MRFDSTPHHYNEYVRNRRFRVMTEMFCWMMGVHTKEKIVALVNQMFHLPMLWIHLLASGGL